ncbi:MAG TPA: ATP-grasp domain-containing protein [Kofleriaceae bacterium]
MKTQRHIKLGLVDPIRTAKAFIPELERRNIDYVVIESGLVEGVRESTTDPERFVQAEASVDVLAGVLRKRKLTHLMPCIEHSMIYAEQLCAQVGLPFNGLRLSEARRNKQVMIETLSKANVRVPRQLETDQLSAVLAFARDTQYPIVIKPVSSGGTDNVYLCRNDAEATENFHRVFGAKNLINCINTTVLAQEYVDGIEYVIDSVSKDGEHASIDFMEYQKNIRNGRAFVYEKVRVLRPEDPISQRLRVFAYHILDELEVRDGASHMEVKLNSRGELVFIEVGARLSGGDSYRMVQDARADGKSQLEFVLDTVQGLPLPRGDYETAKEVVRVCIITESEGKLEAFKQLETIEQLRSCARIQKLVKIGQMVPRTTDLSTLVGYVELAHPDAKVLAEDERRLDEILRQGVLVFA